MNLTENELRALHAEACAAVLSTDRCLTPAEDAFWPLYIQALLNANASANTLSQAEHDVLAERRRHVDVEGFSAAHDDANDPGDLASAAAAFTLNAACQLYPLMQSPLPPPYLGDDGLPLMWPLTWDATWWKPKTPREDLVRAGSLILAEIERIDRDPGDESIHHHINGGDHA